MTIKTNNLGMSYLADTQLIAELINDEGNILVPYADSRGIATIGIGVNLRERTNMALVLDQLGVFSTYIGKVNADRAAAGITQPLTTQEINYIYNGIVDDFESVVSSFSISHDSAAGMGNSASEGNFQAALNLKLQSYLGNATSKFKLDDAGVQAKAITKEIILGNYSIGPFSDTKGGLQGKLDAILGNTSTYINLAHDTREYEAIMSMFYNAQSTVPANGGLATAIKQGNRAEAWFQIRYNTNKDALSVVPPNDAGGIANRRYHESDLFGLFDSTATPTADEARQAYQMFTLHRDTILQYENHYSPTNSNAASITIETQLDPAKIFIFGMLGGSSNPDVVNAYQKWVGKPGHDPASFNATDIYLDPGRVLPTQTASLDFHSVISAWLDPITGTNNTHDSIVIGESNTGSGDVLLAGNGNDLLVGGAGNDILIGGAGQDFMAGGKGDDLYIVQGGSTVTIEDKSGHNSLEIAGKSVDYFFSTDGGYSWDTKDPGFTAVKNNGDFTITYKDPASGQVTTVTLNQNFQSGDFGITLVDSTPITQSSGTANRTITGDFKPLEKSSELAASATVDPTWIVLSKTVGQTSTDAQGNIVVVTYVYKYNQVDDLGNVIPDTGQPDPNHNDFLYGSSGNDLINAGGGVNVVDAVQGGNDTINGGDGGNNIAAGDGNNVITTGSGNDTIIAGKGNNVVSGGGGQDIIIIGNGNNQIYAGTQTDLATALAAQKTAVATGQKGSFIAVGDGNNTIVGGTGNDLIMTGAGNNTIVCGPGSVTVSGGVEGNGAASNWSSATPAGYSPYTNYSGITYTSAPFTAPANYFGNYAGSNPVGLGNDTIFGGTGNSVYWLSNGNNWLDAGGGNDVILAGIGNNTIFGGVGNDTIYGAGGNNFINLESGNDQVTLEGGNNTVIGGSGDCSIVSGFSDNWATSATNSNNYIYGGSGNTTIWGSGGNDTLISGSAAGTGKASQIVGGDGNEYIVGGNGNDSIWGGNGSDTIYAGDGNATIQLSSNATEKSTVYGGNGSDSIVGGGGTDVISAGDGGTANAATTVIAGSGTSTIYGGAGFDILKGGSGKDTLIAGTGTSTLIGGSGTEVMYSSIGNATLYAGSGSDTLYGGSGTDVLQGGTGKTLFVAGSGNETIIGGTGTNTYEFDAGFGNVALKATYSSDTIKFGPGISASDLTVSAITSNGTPALLIQSSSGGQLIIDNGLNGAIRSFSFADSGQTLSLKGLLAQANLVQSSVVDASGNSIDFGGNGNSTLTGGGGNNTFYIAGGNNTINVTNSSDVINAQTNSGGNTVVAGVSYALSDNLQNLTLTGTANVVGTGNSGDNVITANSGNDTLIGGGGNDTLIGGNGIDTFGFSYGSTGMETVSSAQGGIIQLNGIGLGQLQFSQPSGTQDLLIQVGSGSQANSMLIQGYYSNPAAWTISDSQNNTSPLQTAVDAAAQRSQLLTGLENNFIAQVEQGIIAIGGYTLQADGSLYVPVGLSGGVSPLSAYDTITKTTSTTTQIFGSSTVIGTPTTSTSETWNPLYVTWGVPAVIGHTGHFNVTSTTLNDAVINADSAFTSGTTEYGTKWLQVDWTRSLNSSWGGFNSGATLYIYNQGLSFDPNATNLGAKIGVQQTVSSYTTQQYYANGTITGVLSSPGSLPIGGVDPKAVATQYINYQYNYNIQTINLGISGQTVYAGAQTIVNSNSGNDTIYNAGFAYGGTGNDTMLGGGTLMAGTGNDLLIGGNTMIAGSGKDQIFTGSGSATIQIDPNAVTSDLLGGTGDTNQFVNSVYASMGITNVQQSAKYGGMYAVSGEYVNLPPFVKGGGYVCYFTYDQIPLMTGPYQWLADYINSNPQLVSYVQPLPSVTIPSANDFQALATYFNNGILPQHTVTFGQGVTAADLHFSWGRTLGSIGGNPGDAQSFYTTLNISWGTSGQSVQVMIPHSNDPVGSGISQFTFADGTALNMAQMIAMAPPAPTFDPQIFQYQPGMGAQHLGAGYTGINFGPGITSSMVTLGLGSLMLRVGNTGDVIHITNFDPANALAANSIQSFNFADGTSLSYDQLLSRGFDIYGTTGDQVLSGTNLVNRIYGGSGNDTLIGSGTSDTLVAGSGIDTLIGGTGNETFVVNNSADIVTANAGAASNSIESSVSYVMSDNVQKLTLTGSGNLTATGNNLNDVILGNAGYDTLVAGSGNDTLIAGTGGGTMVGGAGSDTFVLDLGAKQQTIVDTSKTTGDTIRFGTGVAFTDTLFKMQGNDLLVSYGKQGDSVLVQNFVSGGQMLVNQFQFGDGTSGISFNADGSYVSSYTGINGDKSAVNYDAVGNRLSDNWTKVDGSHGSDTFNKDGSSAGISHHADGSYQSYTNDGIGDITTNNYDASGTLLSYTVFAGDKLGNGTTTNYDAAGHVLGYSISTNDGMGDTAVTNYSAGKVKLSDTWTKADGTRGSDIFNADGSSSSTVYNADGSYSIYTNDGLGDTKTANYNANNNLLSDTGRNADGSNFSDTFNTNGASSGSFHHADGSYYTYTKDRSGNYVESDYRADGVLAYKYASSKDGSWSKTIFNADGSSYGNIHKADGSSDAYTNDGHGDVVITLYDINGVKNSDTWSAANGLHGSDIFNVDGSSSGTSYAADGSHSSYVNDGLGNITTTNYDSTGTMLGYSASSNDGLGNIRVNNFDAHGNLIGDSGQNSDGSSYSDTYYADGSSSGATHNADGSYYTYTQDPQGNYAELDYNASGVKISDYFSHPDGSWSEDYFNADGSSYGDTHHADASHSSYTNDGHGSVKTDYFDASGNLLGYSIAVSDGLGDITTTSYDANGNVTGQSTTGNNADTILTPVSYSLANQSKNSHNLTGTGTADITLTGNDLNNVITANSGNDTLIAGAGVATLIGGTGNDTFVVNNVNDVVQAQSSGSNINTVLTSVNYVAPANVQNLTGVGSADLTLTGNDLNNVIAANSGNDTLIAGSGIATLIGGTGNDTFVVDSISDVVQAGVGGTNTIESSVSYTASANVQNLTGIGSADLSLTGNDLNNVLTANSGNDTLIAGSGLATMIGGTGNDTFVVNNVNDVVRAQSTGSNINTVLTSVSYVAPANVQNLTGTGSADLTLTGNNLIGTITANSGNDTLIAGSGVATMVGGAGNDTFIVNHSADVVLAQANAGINTVQSSVDFSMDSNAQNVQNLTLTADHISGTGNALNNNLVALGANDTLIAGSGVATMTGSGRNDTFVVNNVNDVVIEQPNQGNNTVLTSVSYVAPANVQNLTGTGVTDLTLTGNDLNNVITANSGNDTLIAGSGLATMVGGTGNDLFIVNNSADTVEAQLTGNNTNTVESSVNYSLADRALNVQNLTGIGSANITLTGNGLNNVITANGGNDTLVAGSGAATLIGGSGNDTFMVNNVNDVVQAQSSGSNVNTVLTSVSYVAPANVQNLTGTGTADLSLTGNSLGNTITANSGNDMLVAGSGVATLIGGTGNDFFVVNNVNDVVIAKSTGTNVNTIDTSVNYTASANVQNLVGTGTEDLTLTGNNLNNVITANSGNDTLVAGSGVATMIGGTGSDTFVVNNVNDVVQAQSSGGNINTVLTSVSYVAPANVQNLTGTGSADLTLTGNNLINTITANSGNDTLIAGSGVATMIGGTGSDTFIVNNVNDVVQAQSSGSNVNTVLTSVSYVAPANVQNLSGLGSADLTLTGNSLDNIITANSGNDTLTGAGGNDTFVGGAGNDLMIGGTGNDTYVYNQGNGLDNLVDTGGTNTVRLGAGLSFQNVVVRLTYADGTPYTVYANGNGEGDHHGGEDHRDEDSHQKSTNLIAHMMVLDSNGVEQASQGMDFAVTVDNHGNFTSPIQSFQFSDGSSQTFGNMLVKTETIDAEDIRGPVITGRNDAIVYAGRRNTGIWLGTGNDIVYASEAGSQVYAGGGNDYLVGSRGNDTFVGGWGVDVLQGGEGNDVLSDLHGRGALLGGEGNDTITAGAGNDFIAGGRGNDLISTGATHNVIAFNKGDGRDTILAAPGASNTLSLGGEVDYRDLSFSKSGNDLVLNEGRDSSVTFKDWYASSANHDFVTLQVINEASRNNDCHSNDPLSNKVEEFDFSKLVAEFDNAQSAHPWLGSWKLVNGLLDAHLAGSDTAALGGDLAYQYGTERGLSGMGLSAVQNTLKDPQFGATAQTLHSWPELNTGTTQIR